MEFGERRWCGDGGRAVLMADVENRRKESGLRLKKKGVIRGRLRA